MEPTAHDLWSFSLRVYPLPNVEQICLELQSRWQLHVNMLLYCCWRAEMDQPAIRTEQIRRLMLLTDEWQQTVVQPLRGLRMRVKPLAQGHTQGRTFYSQLKRAELQAEHIEQNMLQVRSRFDMHAEQSGAYKPKQQAEENISAYLQALNIKQDTALRKCITQLLNAVFG